MKTSRPLSVSTSLGLMLTVILLSGMTLSSCKNNRKATETSSPETPAQNVEPQQEQPVKVDYVIAENYFIKNNAELPADHKIKDKETFSRIFGMATTMGENGKPTEIDFEKSFVIVVEEGILKKQTELEPGLLIHDNDGLSGSNGTEPGAPVGHLTFKYFINEGDDISYTIRPVLIIIVDKAYENLNVELIGEVAI